MPQQKPKIGCYLRVSTTDKQTTASQRQAIRDWARSNHIPNQELVWFEDKKSGATTDRPQLAKILRAIEQNKIDTLVVFRLDRLARSTRDGLQILADVGNRGVRVVSVSENIDFGNSTGRLIASILLSVSSFEREILRERIVSGMHARKMAGHSIGRPRNTKRLQTIRKLFDSGTSAVELATKFGCTRANIYSALSKTQDKKAG